MEIFLFGLALFVLGMIMYWGHSSSRAVSYYQMIDYEEYRYRTNVKYKHHRFYFVVGLITFSVGWGVLFESILTAVGQ